MSETIPLERSARRPRRRITWAVPLGLVLALTAYHFWDLTLRPLGTGLKVRIVSPDEVKRVIERDEKAIVLDVRLHWRDAIAERTLHVPSMQLERRMGELEPYRHSPVFVLAATEEEGASIAARLVRSSFERVGCVRITPGESAYVRAPTKGGRLD